MYALILSAADYRWTGLTASSLPMDVPAAVNCNLDCQTNRSLSFLSCFLSGHFTTATEVKLGTAELLKARGNSSLLSGCSSDFLGLLPPSVTQTRSLSAPSVITLCVPTLLLLGLPMDTIHSQVHGSHGHSTAGSTVDIHGCALCLRMEMPHYHHFRIALEI